MKNELLILYKEKEEEILKKLSSFKNLPEENYKEELLFCILTPQSKAKNCWQAVEQIKKLKNPTYSQINEILKKQVRFHNRKSLYIIEALKNWQDIRKNLSNENKRELRDWLANNVKGIGLKEASHFLRNIGKSQNQIAILDRHILLNLKKLKNLSPEIKTKKQYYFLENEFLNLSKELKIPADALDLLLWSKQTGEIFK